MLKKLNAVCIPQLLKGSVLVNQNGLPRYWSTIYAIYFFGDLADNTKEQKLRWIDKLAITELNLNYLTRVCESYFVRIQNQTTNHQLAESQWKTCLDFLLRMLELLAKTNIPTQSFFELNQKFDNLKRLYGQLRISKPKRVETIRSLPANLVSELYLILNLESANNPFNDIATKWRIEVASQN